MKLHIGVALIALVLVTLFYTYQELLPRKTALLEGRAVEAAQAATRRDEVAQELPLEPPLIHSLTGLETEAGALRAFLKTSL